MRTLYLMRHATAAASGPDGTDRSRPLTPKGKLESEAIGKFLRRTGLLPGAAACSSAARAQETADLVLKAAGSKLNPVPVPELYNAAGGEILAWLRGYEGTEESLLLVAHMPGVAELIGLLAPEGTDFAMAFSPGTLVVIESEAGRWKDWQHGHGSLQLVLPAAHAGRA